MKLAVLSYFLISVFLLSPVANADKLLLSDLVRIGLKRSPSVKKAEADLNDAIDTTKEIRGNLFPNVYADVSQQSNQNSKTLTTTSNTANPSSTETYKAYIAATQPIYTSGALTSGINQRQISENISSLAKVSAEQKLVSDLVAAYYSFAQQFRLYKAAQENVEILENYNKIISRFEHIGRARSTDKMLSDINLTTARAASNFIDSLVLAQKEQLRQLLAIEELPDVDLESNVTLDKVDKINVSEAVAIAMRSNPDILSSEKQAALIQTQKDVDVAQDLPSLQLSGQVGYQSPDRPRWFDNSSQYSQVVLELKIPLFSGLSSIYKRRSYEEKKVSAIRTSEITKLSVEAGLKSQLKELESSFERLNLSREAALKARNALEIGNRDFQRSLISPQDVLSLQTARYNAEQNFINTLFSYLNALLKTRTLMGINLEAIYAKK